MPERFLNGTRIRLSSVQNVSTNVRPIRIRPVDGGLKVSTTGELIEPKFSPAMRDVSYFRNELRKAFGGIQLGADFDEAVQWVETWRRLDGLYQTVVITTKNLLSYNPTTGLWVEISPSDTLTGTIRNPVSVQFFNDVMYFSSLDYELRSWSGNISDVHTVVSGGRSSKALETINNRLVLAHIIESGDDRSQTIKWTINGGISFTGTGSGTRDLTDREDSIQNIKKLGPFRGMIYKTESIVDMRSTGDIANPFDTTEMASLGLLLANSLISWAGGHFFVGSDENIYFFNGTGFEDIGSDIRDEFFSSLNYSSLDRAVGHFAEDTREYIIAIPTGTASNTAPSLYYAYEPKKKRWRSGLYRNLSCFGRYKTSAGISWDEDAGTWDQATDTWNDEAGTESRRQTLVGTDTKRVFLLDSAQLSFDGTALSFSYETGDMVGEEDGDEITLVEVIIGYIIDGTATLIVDISRDRGTTFTNSKNVALGGAGLSDGDFHYAHASFLVTGNNIRVRIRNSSSSEKVRIISITPRISMSKSSRTEAKV